MAESTHMTRHRLFVRVYMIKVLIHVCVSVCVRVLLCAGGATPRSERGGSTHVPTGVRKQYESTPLGTPSHKFNQWEREKTNLPRATPAMPAGSLCRQGMVFPSLQILHACVLLDTISFCLSVFLCPHTSLAPSFL